MAVRTISRRELFKGCGLGLLALRFPALSFGNEPEGKTLVEHVATWVTGLRYEELPPEVIARAKRVLLDTLGCALGALDADPVRRAQQVVSQQGGNPQATPLGVSWKTSCDQAAFLNGMALRFLDLNDYAASGRPHHPSINVAPALAVAEMRGLGGQDLLLGITAGYEAQLRLRDATAKGTNASFDHSTTAHFSSAAVAGKLLGLDVEKMAHALAIAVSHGSTLGEVRQGELSMWKGAAEPMGARTGTLAALLARGGLTGPLTVFEGNLGYAKLVSGGLGEEILRERSGPFRLLKSCIKMWPCVGTAQAAIAAALEIRRRKVTADQIESLTVSLSDFAYKQQMALPKDKISTRETADHSVGYIVARAFLEGDIRKEYFDENYFTDPRALGIVKKVSYRSDPALTALYPESLGAYLEVKLRNGTVERAEVPYPPGHTNNPVDDDTLIRKFLSLAEDVLGKARAQRAVEIVLSIDAVSNLGELVSAIAPARPA